jgi:uncharacterized protein
MTSFSSIAQVVLAYTEDTIWRNRDQFLHGHNEVKQFLTKKWQKETRYKYVMVTVYSCLLTCIYYLRLRKELFAFADNKIAVQFW